MSAAVSPPGMIMQRLCSMMGVLAGFLGHKYMDTTCRWWKTSMTQRQMDQRAQNDFAN